MFQFDFGRLLRSKRMSPYGAIVSAIKCSSSNIINYDLVRLWISKWENWILELFPENLATSEVVLRGEMASASSFHLFSANNELVKRIDMLLFTVGTPGNFAILSVFLISPPDYLPKIHGDWLILQDIGQKKKWTNSYQWNLLKLSLLVWVRA